VRHIVEDADISAQKTQNVDSEVERQKEALRIARAQELRDDVIQQSVRVSNSEQSEHFAAAMKAVFDTMPPLNANGDIATFWAQMMISVRQADNAGFLRALHAGTLELRQAALEEVRQAALKSNATPEEAERLIRRMDVVIAKIGDTFRAHYAHSIALAAFHATPSGISSNLKQLAIEHPAILALVTTDPKRAEIFYQRYSRTKRFVDTADGFYAYVVSRKAAQDAPLRALMRATRPEMPSEAKVLTEAVLAHGERRHFHSDSDLNSSVALPKATAIDASLDLLPGLRVIHPDHGPGTVEFVSGDQVTIRYDTVAIGPVAPTTFEPGLWHISTDPDPRFGSAGPFKDTAEVLPFLQDLERFRQMAGFPKSGPEGSAGTVAGIFLNGKVFHGTSVDVDFANYSLPNWFRKQIFEALMMQHGLNVKDQAFQNAQFLGHAEAEAMIQAYLHFGALPEVLDIFADRTTCNSCSKDLIILARALGVKQMRVYYGKNGGHTMIVRM
jgi:hypothetical protein